MGNLFCCIQVHQSTVAIKERFGKFEEVLEPGCHFLPWILGYQRAGNVSLRLQQLEVNCEVKTKDNTFVYIVASVYYQALADKAVDVFYKLSDTRSLIKTYVISVTRAVVAKRNLRDIFGRRNEIAKAVDKELEKAMSDYGYKVVQTLIIDMRADMLIEEAMGEINAANRKARAEKILQIKRAEGNLPGLSIAPQHQAIVDGLRYSELGFSENVPRETANDVIDMDIVTQY